MASPMNLRRRSLLEALALGASSFLFAPQAEARRRPRHGGSVQLYLPLNLTRIDPHDPHDLTAALLGGSLFETLFARTESGSYYPALASKMPIRENGRTVIEVRPGLRFSSGRAMSVADMAHSLRRSAESAPWLKDLGTITPQTKGTDRLAFSQKSPDVVLRLLANPRSAIVPNNFSPTAPDTSGSLRVKRTGNSLELNRNPFAPRGGSYLDELVIQSASMSDCLRAFEARRSDLGFLGAGFHRDRKKSRRFSMAPVGLALVQPGKSVRSRLPVGSLHEALARLSGAPFLALGVKRNRPHPQRFTSPARELLVPKNEPWLHAIAQEIEHAFSSTSQPLSLKEVTRPTLAGLKKSGSFDLLLEFLGTHGMTDAQVTEQLFRMDGKAAPRGGRTVPPLEAARQLSLGIVGQLEPAGAISNEVLNLTNGFRFSLEEAERTG